MESGDTVGMHDVHSHAVRQVCAQHLKPPVVEAWLHGRTPEGYQRAADDEGERFWVALNSEDRVVGFAGWRGDELTALFVLPECHGRGIGSELFQACEEDARNHGLQIVRLDTTLNAVRFYEQFGFHQLREGYREKRGQRIPHMEMERDLM